MLYSSGISIWLCVINQMKIIVCGDSFFTQDPLYLGTHFCELIGANYDSNLQVYSKFGASNFAIALQLEHAINQKPDLVLFGLTSVDRFEIPSKPYVFKEGVKNIIYSGHQMQPSFYDLRKTTTISNSYVNLQQTDFLKEYFVNHYDQELKRAQDFLMVRSMLYKLEKDNIPFVFTRGGLTGPNWTEWSAQEVDFNTASPWNFVEDHTPIYHTTTKKQTELSRLWIDKINALYNFV